MSKLTQEEFVERAKKVHGEKYDYSEVVYVNATSKIKIFCRKCGRSFEQKAKLHLYGCGCRFCTHYTKRLTQEEFISRSRKIHGDKYDYSEAVYVNAGAKIKIRCLQCDRAFEQTPACHLIGQGCRHCATLEGVKLRTFTTEIFTKKAREIHGDKYDYNATIYGKSYTDKVKIFCLKCCEFFFQRADLHLRGQGHTKCAACKKRMTVDRFLEICAAVHGDAYDYSKVVLAKNKDKITIYCKKCQEDFIQSRDSHLRGGGCPICGTNKAHIICTKTQQEFIDNAQKIHGNKYNYSKTIYKNFKEKILIICNKCGSEFWQVAASHIYGCGCPHCQASKGETQIGEWLQNNNIKYKTQKTFPQCKDKRPLKFDFYLPDHNILIEYDGELHYKAIDYFGGKKNLKLTQTRDRIKNNFTITSGIRLLRIPYFYKKYIELILSLALNVE